MLSIVLCAAGLLRRDVRRKLAGRNKKPMWCGSVTTSTSWRGPPCSPPAATNTNGNGDGNVKRQNTQLVPTRPSVREVRRIIDQALAGDESVLPALRQLLRFPKFVDKFGGNL